MWISCYIKSIKGADKVTADLRSDCHKIAMYSSSLALAKLSPGCYTSRPKASSLSYYYYEFFYYLMSKLGDCLYRGFIFGWRHPPTAAGRVGPIKDPRLHSRFYPQVHSSHTRCVTQKGDTVCINWSLAIKRETSYKLCGSLAILKVSRGQTT